jgi:integrase
MTILAELAQQRQGEFVFPGRSVKRPLSNMAMLKTLERMERNDLTVHGFRSTFRDWAAESTAYPPEVVEMALAHTISNKVEAAYRRGDLFVKRARLMEEWGRFCVTVKDTSANLIAINRSEVALERAA